MGVQSISIHVYNSDFLNMIHIFGSPNFLSNYFDAFEEEEFDKSFANNTWPLIQTADTDKNKNIKTRIHYGIFARRKAFKNRRCQQEVLCQMN